MAGQMLIWWKWLNRQAKCQWDSDMMDKGSPVVVGSLRTNRGYYIRMYWHPECYLKQGMDYLESIPYEPTTRSPGPGRPAIDLSHTDRLKRRALIVKFSRLRDRREEVAELGLLWMLDKLDKTAWVIMAEMKTLGGVPTSWTR
jgi:hypothetical protein